MRLTELDISNFRAIERFQISNLSDFIVIAGPNGCGKSCVLDAIRLLKSYYGGYQQNELQQWFGEFQIDLSRPANIARLFRDQSEPIRISATIELAQSELDHLSNNAEKLVQAVAWSRRVPFQFEDGSQSPLAYSVQYPNLVQEVRAEAHQLAAELRASLTNPRFQLWLEIHPDSRVKTLPSPAMRAVFQTFDPENLGIIDYHGASRNYQRENIGGINLDITGIAQQRRSQSLYNWQSKYSSVKTELASTYVRSLIAQASGLEESATSDLDETLKELFQIFFPDKTYLGVTASSNGTLEFPVRTRSGHEHDINELSSGEKEVLYGYLRLRNSTPLNSTILLDEPELHLNPGLLEGFSDFYYRHLGSGRGNQLWLVTHSDTLLRQAVGNSNYSVFHMTSAADGSRQPNQALPVVADNELERATIDLVGDLAAYRPRSKVVLFEGGGDTEFDTWMTRKLFPIFAQSVNLVSGGSKRRVNDLHEVLSRTAEQIGMANRFFSITDRDSDEVRTAPPGARRFSWNSYHIENYLLEPNFILAATKAVVQIPTLRSTDDVLDALRESSSSVMGALIIERLRRYVNGEIVRAIKIGANPGSSPGAGLLPSVAATFDRLDAVRPKVTSETSLSEIAAEIEEEFRTRLDDGTWISHFPGRLILKNFADRHLHGRVDYEAFRTLVIDKMAEAGWQPPGMAEVLTQISTT